MQHCTALYSAVDVYCTGVRALNKHTRLGFEVFSALFLRMPFLWYMMMVCDWEYDVAVSLGILRCVTRYKMQCH